MLPTYSFMSQGSRPLYPYIEIAVIRTANQGELHAPDHGIEVEMGDIELLLDLFRVNRSRMSAARHHLYRMQVSVLQPRSLDADLR